MENSVAAADRRIAHVAEQSIHEARLEPWTVRKAKPGLDIIFVSLDAVVDSTGGFVGRRYVLVPQTEIEHEIRPEIPLVFAVEVCFPNAVLEKEWTVPLLIVWRATVEDLVKAVNVIDPVTRGYGAVVKAT